MPSLNAVIFYLPLALLILIYLFCTSQVSSPSDQLPVTTKSHLVAVTGPANRILLTKEILDFCGALPIYNIELIRGDPIDGNGTASKMEI